jgi:hypothetical protein
MSDALKAEAIKLETDVVNAAKKLKAGLEDAGDDAVKVAAWLQNNQALIEKLAGLAGTGAASVSAVGLNLVSLAVTAVKSAGAGAAANGISIPLDQSAISAVEALIAAIEKV